MNKIFGIGANKTGTSSLAKALEILGYKISHWDHHEEISKGILKYQFNYKFLKKYDGVVDLPIPSIYKELDQHYPGSKFILTIRDASKWIKSEEAHHKLIGEDQPIFECFLMYGSYFFNNEMYLKRYAEHNEEVLEYFKDRPEDLLVLDISNDNAWSSLCKFLGKPVTDQPFPHENKGDYMKA